MTNAAIGSWADVKQLLEGQPQGTLLRVPRGWLEHPKTFGMKSSASFPIGQTADYFKRIDEKTGLHVADFRSFYVARLHAIDEKLPVQRGCRAGDLASGAVALGALIGASLGRSERATLVGAALAGTLLSSLIRGWVDAERGPTR
jgi:hypothetical protein